MRMSWKGGHYRGESSSCLKEIYNQDGVSKIWFWTTIYMAASLKRVEFMIFSLRIRDISDGFSNVGEH